MLHPCYRTYQKLHSHFTCCVHVRTLSSESMCILEICRSLSSNFITHKLHPKSWFSKILSSQLPCQILTFPPFLERMPSIIFTVETQQPNSLANYKKKKKGPAVWGRVTSSSWRPPSWHTFRLAKTSSLREYGPYLSGAQARLISAYPEFRYLP